MQHFNFWPNLPGPISRRPPGPSIDLGPGAHWAPNCRPIWSMSRGWGQHGHDSVGVRSLIIAALIGKVANTSVGVFWATSAPMRAINPAEWNLFGP